MNPVKDLIKETKVIKITPFFDRAKTSEAEYRKAIAREYEIQSRTEKGDLLHSEVKAATNWYIKLFKNLAKASKDKDEVKFNDLLDKYGSLLNLQQMSFRNTEKLLNIARSLENLLPQIGIIPALSQDEKKVQEQSVAEVIDALIADDDLGLEDEAEMIEVSEPEVVNVPVEVTEREPISDLFSDQNLASDDVADPISMIGNSGEALDSSYVPPVTVQQMQEKILLMPPGNVRRLNAKRGVMPGKRG